MRSQLLTSTLAAVAAAVLLLGFPLAYAVSGLLRGQALDALQLQAETVAGALSEPGQDPLDQIALLEQLAGSGRGVRLLLYGPGVPTADTDAPPEIPSTLRQDVQLAVNGQIGRAAAGGILAVSVPLRSGEVFTVFRVVTEDRELAAAVRRSWLAIGVLALISLATAATLARMQGDRLAAPMESLADAARRLGDGDFTVRAPYSGVPEADDVAKALQVTAERLGAMLERSRSFSADASHQLRTPLTALRLDLEALEAVGSDPELVVAATKEADRLEATIAELLALSEAPAHDRTCDVTRIAAERLDAWQSLARAAGREVVLKTAPVPLVRARAGAIGQSLQVLLDNALEHGSGTITLTVEPVAAGGGRGLTGDGRDTRWVRLCVADEGPGIPPERRAGLLSGRADGASGRGLALARQLVEAEGGRLTLERPLPGAVLCLLLPAAVGAVVSPPAVGGSSPVV